MQDFIADNPNLVAFLEERLPQLGLDGETYGMYVLGTSDDEELQEIMQLLQASSEVEDEIVWEQLTNDIQEKLKLDQRLKEEKEEEQRQHKKALLEQSLAQAKEQLHTEPTTTTTTTKSHSSAVDEATKKALLSRFAYDQDEDDNLEESEAPLTNREAAAQASQEKSQELRSHKVQTKKEEQQKTKEQKASKQQLKEDRRKRTQKAERKR